MTAVYTPDHLPPPRRAFSLDIHDEGNNVTYNAPRVYARVPHTSTSRKHAFILLRVISLLGPGDKQPINTQRARPVLVSAPARERRCASRAAITPVPHRHPAQGMRLERRYGPHRETGRPARLLGAKRGLLCYLDHNERKNRALCLEHQTRIVRSEIRVRADERETRTMSGGNTQRHAE